MAAGGRSTTTNCIKRDKVNLDIFWLKDKSLEDSDDLPDPDVLAQEIADDMQTALEQFLRDRGKAEGIGKGGPSPFPVPRAVAQAAAVGRWRVPSQVIDPSRPCRTQTTCGPNHTAASSSVSWMGDVRLAIASTRPTTSRPHRRSRPARRRGSDAGGV